MGKTKMSILLNYLRGPIRNSVGIKVIVVFLIISSWITYMTFKVQAKAGGSLVTDGGLIARRDQGDGKSIFDKIDKESIRKNLGRSTWTLLHTMAARLPDEMGNDDEDNKIVREDVEQFVKLLSKLYPCGECAEHFRGHLKERPIRVGGKEDFKQWLCEIHNDVNKMLEKDLFDCKELDTRWTCGCKDEV